MVDATISKQRVAIKKEKKRNLKLSNQEIDLAFC